VFHENPNGAENFSHDLSAIETAAVIASAAVFLIFEYVMFNAQRGHSA
jgi:hypothetical protein